MKFNGIEEVLSYIESRKNFQLGLYRVIDFLESAHIDYNQLKYIHIGGTNGKGSTSYYLSNILIQQGYKTGFFSSPSIQGHNDRIRINNEFISDEEIVAFVNTYYDLIEKTEVTMFEIDVLMALDYFVKNKVEYVVMEVGMGGRFDGTNIIHPLLSIITNIGMDHTDYLGDTKEEIAYNKAGIIKEKSYVVTAELDDKALHVIKEYALEMDAKVVEVKDATITSTHPLVFDYENFKGIKLKTLALYQVRNACTVLEAINLLRNMYGIKIDDAVIYDVFASITWPGRFEVVCEKPFVVIDGAHNAEGIDVLCQSLNVFDDYKKTILFTALADKDSTLMQSKLASVCDQLVLTTFDFYRASTLEGLDPENKYMHVLDYETYLKDKIGAMAEDEMLIVTGSLYFIALIRTYLYNVLKLK